MYVVIIGVTRFIGSHFVDASVQESIYVRVVDNLDERVQPDSVRPSYLNPRWVAANKLYLRIRKCLLVIPQLEQAVRHWKEIV
jgi:nucleoside-diphosphate-sugar epimerase